MLNKLRARLTRGYNAVVSKVGRTASGGWGGGGLTYGVAKRQGGGWVALEVGPSERVVRLFTTKVTFIPDIGKLVSLNQAHPSHYEFSSSEAVTECVTVLWVVQTAVLKNALGMSLWWPEKSLGTTAL
jgi:hypothetical protein